MQEIILSDKRFINVHTRISSCNLLALFIIKVLNVFVFILYHFIKKCFRISFKNFIMHTL